MSWPPEPFANDRRCTVAVRAGGGPCSIVAEELSGGIVVLYPHGVEGNGVVLDRDAQLALGAWLASRQHTKRRIRQ